MSAHGDRARRPEDQPDSEEAGQVSILLVDDRRENLVALEAVLSRPDYHLVRASSGTEALKYLLVGDFAVILLDVMMPGMDGFEVAAITRQRERSRHIPIIFLTAAGQDVEALHRGYEVGAVDFIAKPFDEYTLRSKVSVFVALHRQRVQLQRQAVRLREHERREREREVEELKRSSERRYQNLAEAIPQIVWMAAPDGPFQYFNGRWVDYTGRDRDASRDWAWVESVHEEDAPGLLAQWRASIESGAPCQAELRLRDGSTGGYRWYLARALPERDTDGRIVAWLGTFTDIDDQKRAELSAAEALRVRDEFLTIASHELRTPLTSLQLLLQGLLRALPDGVRDPAWIGRLPGKLHSTERQVVRLTRLVGELLDVSRIATGHLHLAPEQMDLGEVARRVVDAHQPDLTKAGCTATLEVHGDVGGFWDPLRMEQVLSNLLSNAAKFGAARSIEVIVSGDERGVRLEVRDHGIGIAAADADRVFERFERAVSTRNYGGLGMGLYITRQIVSAHGGSVRLSATPGGGCTFTVDLPRETVSEGSDPGGPGAASGRRAASGSAAHAPS